jgi:hypothetical protein
LQPPQLKRKVQPPVQSQAAASWHRSILQRKTALSRVSKNSDEITFCMNPDIHFSTGFHHRIIRWRVQLRGIRTVSWILDRFLNSNGGLFDRRLLERWNSLQLQRISTR